MPFRRLGEFAARCNVVLAVAVLLGKWNWWPHFGMSRQKVESPEHTGKLETQPARRRVQPKMQPAK